MDIGDSVEVVTGCPDCGMVDAKIIDIVHDRAFVEVVGELPHNVKERNLWIDLKRLRIKNA